MPDIAATIRKALNQLQKRRSKLDDQISALEDALAAVGRQGGRRVAKVKKRARKKMSAAQKKAVSQRMKKYWTERRKAQAKAKVK